jgi:hypothetical protein
LRLIWAGEDLREGKRVAVVISIKAGGKRRV